MACVLTPARSALVTYRTIVADPPWPYDEGFAWTTYGGHLSHGVRTPKGPIEKVRLPYKSMTVRELCDLPVGSLAGKDARLFLWTTNRHLPAAFSVLEAWGFTYRQTLVWDKRPNFNPLGGSVAAIAAEFLLVAVHGSPGRLARWPCSVITARKPRSSHSVKPDVFMDMVETVSPGPYVELFSRRHRLGWDVWGDESANTAQLVTSGKVGTVNPDDDDAPDEQDDYNPLDSDDFNNPLAADDDDHDRIPDIDEDDPDDDDD